MIQILFAIGLVAAALGFVVNGYYLVREVDPAKKNARARDTLWFFIAAAIIVAIIYSQGWMR